MANNKQTLGDLIGSGKGFVYAAALAVSKGRNLTRSGLRNRIGCSHEYGPFGTGDHCTCDQCQVVGPAVMALWDRVVELSPTPALFSHYWIRAWSLTIGKDLFVCHGCGAVDASAFGAPKPDLLCDDYHDPFRCNGNKEDCDCKEVEAERLKGKVGAKW